MKKKFFVLATISIFLLAGFGSLTTTGVKTEYCDYNIDFQSSTILAKEIQINGNAAFTSENGVSNPQAQGTLDDYYIISSLNVKYITISETNKYFLIDDCVFNGEGVSISFNNVENGMVNNCNFNSYENGIDILLTNSNGNLIENCVSTPSSTGNYFFFVAYNSDDNHIKNCEIKPKYRSADCSGVILFDSNNNEISDCKISGGAYGIALENSNNNKIHHNSIYQNDVNAKVISGVNQWDDGSAGNYWDDYTGKDLNKDGIGDSSYNINSNNVDRYPLMKGSGGKTKFIDFLFLDLHPLFSKIFGIFDETKDSRLLELFNKLNSFFDRINDKKDNGDSNSVTVSTTGEGWLEKRDGISILHIGGSYYDMGYQHGYLLKDLIPINLRAQLSYFEENDYPYSRILQTYYDMNDTLPSQFYEEMQGMADGSGLPFEDIAVLNTIPAIFNLAGMGSCCELSLWGPITVNGEMYHIRGWDWTLKIKDPVTGTAFQDTQILIVRDPDNAYASIYPEFAGHIFAWGGFNEKGIAIGETTCRTYDSTLDGSISSAFRMRMVLDQASTAQQAVDIMSNNRGCGWNFVISDANTPQGIPMEQTANILYVGSWDDPVEDSGPFWSVNGLVRRVPFFINPETAATSPGRDTYDPSGINGFVKYLIGTDRSFAVWWFYKTISEAAEDRAGTLNLQSTINMIREVYKGNTNLLFFVLMKIGLVHSIHQWVGCPKTGDIAFAFADEDSYSFENPVHYLNLYELLDSTPP